MSLNSHHTVKRLNGPYSAPIRLLEVQHEHLDDRMLLDMILAPCIRCNRYRQIVIEKLFCQFGCFADCVSASYEDLRNIDGLGEIGISALKMVQAAATRLARGKVLARPIISNHLALCEYLIILLSREPVEHFRVLYLDTKNRVLCDDKITQGTANAVRFEIRAIVHLVLKLNATAIILVHNHPSGDPEPSKEDIDATRRVAAALNFFSVAIFDHVIVGRGRCVSLRHEALI